MTDWSKWGWDHIPRVSEAMQARRHKCGGGVYLPVCEWYSFFELFQWVRTADLVVGGCLSTGAPTLKQVADNPMSGEFNAPVNFASSLV